MSTTISRTQSTFWNPLHQSLFRNIWIASVVSNIGSCMHDVAAGWLMALLADKPIWVSLMTTAGSLPLFLLGLPAGAIADVIDKRRLILITQTWLMIIAGILGVMALLKLTTSSNLLLLTFAMGIGNAVTLPAWQAITPELVPREDITSAVTLNGAGFNISRAIGPALGGLIFGAVGPWAVFILNSISFLSVLIVLYRWKRVHEESILPTERMMNAIQGGLRYVRFSPVIQSIFIWTAGFVFCTSSLWALLPVYVKLRLHGTATSLGIMWTFLGTGAIIGAVIIPYFRKRFSIRSQLTGAAILISLIILGLGYIQNFPLVCLVMFLGGIAWLSFMTTINALVQLNVPSWVRARVLSCYLIIFAGSIALGSVIWGMVATHANISIAFILSALSLFIVLLILRQYRLPTSDHGIDLTPSMHWPEPAIVYEPDLEDGPVLVTVEYKIRPHDKDEFIKAIHPLSILRRRDGSIQWGLYHDIAEPGRYLETFIVESWAEHLRQHERVTVEDRKIQDKIESFHIGDKPPVVTHMIYAHYQPKDGK